jgi:hypothetical protein
LIEEAGTSSWAHFEVISERGWFRNLLYLKEPCVEVAYENEHSLLLIPEIRKQTRTLMPAIPERWPRKPKGLWRVPVGDREELTDWIDGCLAALSGRANYQVSGWIEGL